MKILLSAFACEPDAGSEKGVGWNWAVNLAKKHEVYVITREYERPFIECYLKVHHIENLHFYYCGIRNNTSFFYKFPFAFRLYYKLWQSKIYPIAKEIINEHNIDIIHHLTYNEFRTPGKLYKLDKPFVWGPIGGGAQYNPVFSKAYSKKGLLKEIARKAINRLYVKSRNVRCALKKASVVIVADPATYALMPKCRKYERHLETAYYSDRNPIKDFSDIHNHEKIRLMYAGVLKSRKGLKIVIEALGESDFRDFQFLIIGNGPERKNLQQLVEKYELSDNIKFAGRMSYNSVNNYYDWADLFLFPSMRDTSGNVVLESMSHGTPVVALNHNGVSEIITKECGELIEIHSYEQIKKDYLNTIIKYHNNRDIEIQKGLLARERIENVYSWDKTMEYIDSMYKQIKGDI